MDVCRSSGDPLGGCLGSLGGPWGFPGSSLGGPQGVPGGSLGSLGVPGGSLGGAWGSLDECQGAPKTDVVLGERPGMVLGGPWDVLKVLGDPWVSTERSKCCYFVVF